MSYSLVEVEAAALVKSYSVVLDRYPDDAGVSDLGFQLETFLSAVQAGLENHADECRGVIDALKEARGLLDSVQ